MGGKSDHTKYLTEIAVLSALANRGSPLPRSFSTQPASQWINSQALAWPDLVYADVDRCMVVILSLYGAETFLERYAHAAEAIKPVLETLDYDLPKLHWQSTEKDKDPENPADILFVNSAYNGISVKNFDSPNVKNHGAQDLIDDILIDDRKIDKGEDWFDFLSQGRLSLLVKEVKHRMCQNIAVGETWYDPTSDTPGKYSLQRIGQEDFVIKNKRSTRKLKLSEMIDEAYISPNGRSKRLGKGWRRVFGDWYQHHKDLFLEQRRALTESLLPKAQDILTRRVAQDPDRIKNLGAFSSKPYFFIGLGKQVYLVPAAGDVAQELEVKKIEIEDQTFGAGLKIRAHIGRNGQEKTATVDCWFRYHQGTFASSVVYMIQNLKGKENIWQKLEIK